MIRRRSKLPRLTQRRLIEHFVAGTTARTAAELVGVNRNTAILYYHKLRETIAEHVRDESPFGGEIEMDESYFGGHRKGSTEPSLKRRRAGTGSRTRSPRSASTSGSPTPRASRPSLPNDSSGMRR